jgi:hypothetical protein
MSRQTSKVSNGNNLKTLRFKEIYGPLKVHAVHQLTNPTTSPMRQMPDVPKMPEIPSTANLKMPDVPKMPEIPSTANLKMPDLPKLPMPDVSKPPAAPSTKPDSKPKDTTPDASTKVESKAKESKAKPAATQRGGFKVKDEVSVAAPFESANEDPKKLDKGLRGKVLDIDADGDALIDFKGAIGQQFVPKDQFDKLEKVAPAP